MATTKKAAKRKKPSTSNQTTELKRGILFTSDSGTNIKVLDSSIKAKDVIVKDNTKAKGIVLTLTMFIEGKSKIVDNFDDQNVYDDQAFLEFEDKKNNIKFVIVNKHELKLQKAAGNTVDIKFTLKGGGGKVGGPGPSLKKK
jgi:hypothetical protein